MGKGDKRSRKGKIWRGTHGKSRPAPGKVKKSASKVMPEEKKENSEAVE